MTHTYLRSWLVGAPLALAALTVSAQDTWKLATMMPLTGAMAGYSQELKLGFDIALEEINKKGGILGRQVSLTMMDTQSNAGQVASLIRQACADALIVVGPTLSNEARVAFPVANSLQCPAMGSATGAVGLTTSNRPWSFSFLTPADVLTPAAVDAVARKFKPKKAVIFVEKSDVASQDYANLAANTLKLARAEVETIAVSAADVDFGPVMTRAAGFNPDLVIISTLDRAATGLLKEIRKSPVRGQIMLMQSAYNAVVGALPPEILDGVVRFAQSDPGTSSEPRVKEFIKTFESRSNGRPPSLVATLTYDTLFLARDMIEAANLKGDLASRGDDRKKFVEKLSVAKDWKGLAGTLSMAPQGYMVKPPLVLVARAGKWEPLKD